MPTSAITIIPQRRRKNRGWTACQPHQAKRWALFLPGASAPVALAATEREAKVLASRLRTAASTRPKPAPGARWSDAAPHVAGPGAPIAESLTLAHYQQLKGG